MYFCLYVICMYTCIFYMHVLYVEIYAQIYIYVHIHLCTYIHIYICRCIKYILMHMCACTCADICTCIKETCLAYVSRSMLKNTKMSPGLRLRWPRIRLTCPALLRTRNQNFPKLSWGCEVVLYFFINFGPQGISHLGTWSHRVQVHPARRNRICVVFS